MRIAKGIIENGRPVWGRIHDDRFAPADVPDAGADDALTALLDGAPTGVPAPLADVRLCAPAGRRATFLCVGLNYADHIAESGLEAPEFPMVFAKLSSTIVGPFDDVERPLVSDQLDYEGELAFVIGRRARHVSRERAHEVIAGYTITDDVSVRDWQLKTSQWVLGKSFDTHGPIGPWIVTADELGDPHALALRTFVNGDLRQESNTSNLVHDCFDLVAALSQVVTLQPGDVVATGTPGGVGALMKPPRLLVPGDRVRVEIDGIGQIENRVVDEDPAAGDVERGSAVAAR
jgi:2-keto-4-pentenoate hydratase/2-oxohepta-3-ene-1,7-dioic acid hydratase in catechol pathway